MSSSATNGEAIRQVGKALVARHTEIAKGMVERIVAEVPTYRRAPPDLIDDVLVLSTATAELLGQAFAAGSQVQREDVPIVREHAARRVHQGVSLEAFLHAYRAALFGYWDACAEEASRLNISREAGLALARFALDAIDTVTTHATEAYLREETRVRTQSGREARDLVERLIRGQPIADDRRHPAAPGLNPTGPLVTIVGRIDETTLPVGDALQVARDALEEDMSLGKVRPLVAIRQGEIVLVAAGGSSLDKRTSLRTARHRALDEHEVDMRYGVSLPSPGFPGVRQAYREAALSLSFTSSVRPIVSLDDLSSLECALIGADATTRAAIASKGKDLQALSDEDLAATFETVRAFSKGDLNVARAAQELHVHPNTVRYRLQRIATTTGHDPRTLAGLVELLCILEMIEDERHG
jgi:PucR-like helix-turn-helix protein/diguanylate cyclase with GGDEF domain